METIFDYKEEHVISELKKRRTKKALLQFPEGLKKEATRLTALFEKETNAEIVVSGEPCWGACDLALDEAQKIGAELLIHYGHAPFIKNVLFPVLYIELQDTTHLEPLLQKSLPFLKDYTTLGLVSSVQHVHNLEAAKTFLEQQGKKIAIPQKKSYSYYDGHVVGCEYNTLKTLTQDVDAFLVIGNRFHALGAALSVTKPVYLLDLYNDEVLDMNQFKDKIIKQRFAAIERFKESTTIGIIIGTKPGQVFGAATPLKKKLQQQGKNVLVLTIGELTNDKLLNFASIQAFVELACPRIAIEDYSRYEKPVLTFKEAQAALGEVKWEDLLEHGFL